MIKVLKKYFVPIKKVEKKSPEELNKRIQIATCVLLLEIAKSDYEFTMEEMATIRNILENELGIKKENINEILNIAEEHREENVDIWEYTNLIKQNYTWEEKNLLIEMVWKVIYADGVLDKYEDYLIHKLADLLHISHDELIAAKLKAKPKGISGR